jgi:dynein heavy chain
MPCRFLRHFTMLAVPPPSDAAIKTILTAILSGFLAAEFPVDMKGITAPVVNASVEVYNRWEGHQGCNGLACNFQLH